MGSSDESHLHLAFFVASLRGGGAERNILSLASEAARRGVQVDLVLAQKEGAYLQQVPDNLRLVDLEASRVLTSLAPLTRYLRTERPDSMLSTLNYVNVVAVASKYLSGVSTRLIVREAKVTSKIALRARTLVNSVMPAVVAIAYRLADDIVAISGGVERDLSRSTGLSREDITMIHNPAYFPEIESKAQEKIEHEWLDNPDILVIVGMGRLVPCKNFDVLIDAISNVVQQRNVRLIILGKGDEKERLQKHAAKRGIEDRVELPGFVDNPFSYLGRADAFVMSSTHEAFGNVVVEALATGTPVVSTNCPGGPPEILENGKWGPLVPVGDPDAMASAIEDVLDDPPDPELLRERARDFSVEHITDQYLELMRPKEE